LSVVATPSDWNAHVTPAELTPFHTLVLTVTCRASCRNGFPDPCAVRMIDGSMNTGMPKPPAVVTPSDMARYSLNANTARVSSAVRMGCGSVTSFCHAVR
jgi:hypothetical protein